MLNLSYIFRICISCEARSWIRCCGKRNLELNRTYIDINCSGKGDDGGWYGFNRSIRLAILWAFYSNILNVYRASPSTYCSKWCVNESIKFYYLSIPSVELKWKQNGKFVQQKGSKHCKWKNIHDSCVWFRYCWCQWIAIGMVLVNFMLLLFVFICSRACPCAPRHSIVFVALRLSPQSTHPPTQIWSRTKKEIGGRKKCCVATGDRSHLCSTHQWIHIACDRFTLSHYYVFIFNLCVTSNNHLLAFAIHPIHIRTDSITCVSRPTKQTRTKTGKRDKTDMETHGPSEAVKSWCSHSYMDILSACRSAQ